MPKQRITRDKLLDAAMELLEEKGAAGVTVTALAEKAGCSSQPVYSCLGSMEGLWQALGGRIAAKIQSLILAKLDPEDPFRSTGRAYAQVASEHPHLFRAFASRQRTGVGSLRDLLDLEADPAMTECLVNKLGISPEAARELHLHMLIYNVGLCTVFASCSPDMPAQEIFSQLESAYLAFAAGLQVGEDR